MLLINRQNANKNESNKYIAYEIFAQAFSQWHREPSRRDGRNKREREKEQQPFEQQFLFPF